MMPECTEAERKLIEASLELADDAVRYVSHTPGSRFLDARDDVIRERITPERKAQLVELWKARRSVDRRIGELSEGIPGGVWTKLVREIYPKEPDE